MYPGQENLYHLPSFALMFMSALTTDYEVSLPKFYTNILSHNQVQSTKLPKNQLKYMSLILSN